MLDPSIVQGRISISQEYISNITDSQEYHFLIFHISDLKVQTPFILGTSFRKA